MLVAYTHPSACKSINVHMPRLYFPRNPASQGSIASMRQQSGRAGRREQPSMAIYVAFEGPMDQHFMNHPEDLFGKPIESAQVHPFNSGVGLV